MMTITRIRASTPDEMTTASANMVASSMISPMEDEPVDAEISRRIRDRMHGGQGRCVPWRPPGYVEPERDEPSPDSGSDSVDV
jgi:hypothetical protein